ncbi:two-component system catabolic regulation response regulator CreB [Marinobacterium sp. MBR-111]|jgi:two-component system catabolic regulation response regulator CreB|uniref:Two component transcriptional regulator, winged helix family n=1 Tax=Marinobacterium iners DSM 11526 TaxID=1122198 RepID=A0A1H4G3H1_9GAMM|nr:two-component system response regulator CreB [Marinobacterium iners]SEB04139.1 two component transcriptional regulator, winged helix family [Marinobacterium iners DSM 11526]
MAVLIVEDEPSIADTIRYALETERMVNIWVTTGQQALDALSEGNIELVLLDIGLPDMSGFDVCRVIRQASSVPVVFLTSRHEEIDQVLGLELGADDYITKPFSPRVLTARIRARLRQPQEAANISSAGFSHDADGARIMLNGILLDLSRYEYRLLLLLMSNPGRIYSREQLMQQVWEEPERSFDRTVDTHIKTLRRKIRDISANCDPLKTRRGLGYSFEADA